jgi:hypothetical protein
VARPDGLGPWRLLLLGFLDNAGRPSAKKVHPEWQDLAVGDRLKCLGLPSYRVATLEPNRFLGLYWLADLRGRLLDPSQPRPTAYMEGYWAFQLKELPNGRTRLVIDGYQAARPRWFERLMYDWVFPVMVWIMQARMLVVLKRNIERTNITPAMQEVPSQAPEGVTARTSAAV